MIAEPAADPMSVGQADASRNSLANMWQHSNAMLRYAENYIEKLKASHKQMTSDGRRRSRDSHASRPERCGDHGIRSGATSGA